MILITGANGYIGRSLCYELGLRGIKFIGIDNYATTKKGDIDFLKDKIISCDVLNTKMVIEVMMHHKISMIVHLAGLKSVRQSEMNKRDYLLNNVYGTKSILEAMTATGVNDIIFASTAAVYKYMENKDSYNENDLISANNFYGKTKIACEDLLLDHVQQNLNSSAVALRFFNVGGTIDKSLQEESGENIFPAILDSIKGGRPFKIFGRDYLTPDGSAIRDYVHIQDLIKAITMCLGLQLDGAFKDFRVINLGTAHGTSVLELVSTFEGVFGVRVNLDISNRRDGDVPILLADATLAGTCLGWKATLNTSDIAYSYLE
jgi:UDP-glucose 4-epimerase